MAASGDENAQSPSVRARWMRQVNLVRKQEFAYLRSVQQRAGSEASEATLAGLPARTAATGAVRGDTLKKIDEIEAQLDLLWVASRGKRSDSDFSLRSTLGEDPALATAQLASTLRAAPGVLTQTMRHSDMPSSVLLVPAIERVAPPPAPMAPAATPSPKTPLPHDAVLSTAAALFACAEYDLATHHLLRALRGKDERNQQTLHRLLALLEIYRTTGNQAQFDWSVLEYFDHWGGGTPQWRASHRGSETEPDAGRTSPAAKARSAASVPNAAQVWHCPTVLNRAAARELRAHWLAHRQCAMDWTSLSALDADAASDLTALLVSDQGAPTRLVFTDTPNLLYVLEQATPQGQAGVARSLWELRFCLLRLMHMRAAFDVASTDFCMTYLEQAPVWQEGIAEFVGDALVPAPVSISAPSGTPWRLHGHVVGQQGLGLPELTTKLPSATISIACATLVRMDPDACTQLLQWMRSAKAQKAEVQFSDVSLLVGAAWAAAGVEAYAQVHLRNLP